ncbi:MAG: hypothetical protein EBX41_02950 [Chitinophagia bacterium]|nr:hypothetical protein [Chitinophagia bacterium]
MLEKKFNFYLANQDELVQKYNGKHIVIVDNQVVGSYNSHADAYENAKQTYPLGKFLIQLCTPGSGDYTQTFHTRVIINKTQMDTDK